MSTSSCRGIRVSQHEGEPMGGEGVLQLAGHHGRPTDCVRWVACTQFFVGEYERIAGDSLEEQNERDLRKQWK